MTEDRINLKQTKKLENLIPKTWEIVNKTLFYLSSISLLGVSLSPFVPNHSLAKEMSFPNPQLIAQSTSNSFEDYRQQCLRRIAREGLRGEVAQAICNCVINKFRSRYSLTQFRDLIQKAKTNKTSARTLSEVGEACFEEILYED